MQASAIHYLAVADDPPIIAAAMPEKTVQIWSWKTGQQLGEFKTIFNSGGKRLALTSDGSICIAGGWGRGLAAYSVPNGTLLWHRKDVHKVQAVRLGGSSREIYCGVESSSAHILMAATGESIGRVRGAINIYGSQYSSHRLIQRKGRYEVYGDTEFGVPAMSFALLDAVFSPTALCLSDPGIRLIDLNTGLGLWHLDIGSNHLAFNSSDQRFYCVGSTFPGRIPNAPDRNSLLRLASSIQECDEVVTLGAGQAGEQHSLNPVEFLLPHKEMYSRLRRALDWHISTSRDAIIRRPDWMDCSTL